MPLFAVICRDKPGQLQTRLDSRQAHLGFIRDSGIVRMAGPLIENGDMCGSLIVLEAEDLAAAQSFSAGDPYAVAGLFERVEIRGFRPVLGPSN